MSDLRGVCVGCEQVVHSRLASHVTGVNTLFLVRKTPLHNHPACLQPYGRSMQTPLFENLSQTTTLTFSRTPGSPRSAWLIRIWVSGLVGIIGVPRFGVCMYRLGCERTGRLRVCMYLPTRSGPHDTPDDTPDHVTPPLALVPSRASYPPIASSRHRNSCC